MPRLARLDAPGVLHHIMIRGIERRNIFRVKKDREDFLERLSNLLPETQTSCYAWVLMSNHSGHSVIMGNVERPWQDADYVLGFFSKGVKKARNEYLAYVNAGYNQGHREEFSGGGLIRSLGGWSEISKTDKKGGLHVKSDERILGDSTFVSDILTQTNEKYERKYELKRRGYDLDRVAMRVSEIYKIDAEEILSKGKQQKKVKARSLFCYWATKELEVSLTELSRRIGISVPAVGHSVERGALIAKERNYKLLENET